MGSRTTTLLEKLAHPDRVRVLLILLSRPASNSDLEQATGLAQSSVSKHLGELESLGVVRRDSGSNSVPNPRAVLGVLEQANGLARAGLAAQLSDLGAQLTVEEAFQAELARAREALAEGDEGLRLVHGDGESRGNPGSEPPPTARQNADD
jgi:DNA-binding transcriptional ArsR family regulator